MLIMTGRDHDQPDLRIGEEFIGRAGDIPEPVTFRRIAGSQPTRGHYPPQIESEPTQLAEEDRGGEAASSYEPYPESLSRGTAPREWGNLDPARLGLPTLAHMENEPKR